MRNERSVEAISIVFDKNRLKKDRIQDIRHINRTKKTRIEKCRQENRESLEIEDCVETGMMPTSEMYEYVER